MLVVPLSMLIFLAPQEAPSFTDAHLREAVDCADQTTGRCAPAATSSAAIACLSTPEARGVDAVDRCLASITDRCASRWSATTPEMNTRTILICAAHTSAGLREAADNWLDRAERHVPAPMMAQYRGLRSTVPSRIQAQSAGKPAIEASGTHTGVWASFVMFLWEQQWRYPGFAG